MEKCFQQTVACVLAAINLTPEELEQQLKAGRLEKLPELRKDFFTEKRVEDAMRARLRRPCYCCTRTFRWRAKVWCWRSIRRRSCER